jgi:hypothetical protein
METSFHATIWDACSSLMKCCLDILQWPRCLLNLSSWLQICRLCSALSISLTRSSIRLSGKSKLAEAIRYAISRRATLERFLIDGRVEIDSNIVERAIRPQTIARKTAIRIVIKRLDDCSRLIGDDV